MVVQSESTNVDVNGEDVVGVVEISVEVGEGVAVVDGADVAITGMGVGCRRACWTSNWTRW